MEMQRGPRTEQRVVVSCAETGCRYYSRYRANGCCRIPYDIEICSGPKTAPVKDDPLGRYAEISVKADSRAAHADEWSERKGQWAKAHRCLIALSETMREAAWLMKGLSLSIPDEQSAEREEATQ